MTTDTIRCQGCGIAVQSDNLDAPGYVPASALSRPQIVCRRCYRMTHYGEFTRQSVDPASYEREIAAIRTKPGLVLYVLDVFDLAGSMVTGLARMLRGSLVHLVVNKVDLLPADVDSARLAAWIRHEVRDRGIEVAGVHFVSAGRGIGVSKLLKFLETAHEQTIYVVGMANVGKSTLLNRLKQEAEAADHADLTVSLVPGTTLGMVRMTWHLKNGRVLHLVDTPGFIRGDRLTDYLCPDCLKTVVPQRALKPRIFQLYAGQTLWFGSVCRFDFTRGTHQSVVCYVSNDLVIHRTKLERADDIYEHHADDILKVPCSACRHELGALHPLELSTRGETQDDLEGTQTTVHVPTSGADIVLPGLGWLSLTGAALEGKLWLPVDVTPATRPRLIGDLNRHQSSAGPVSRR